MNFLKGVLGCMACLKIGSGCLDSGLSDQCIRIYELYEECIRMCGLTEICIGMGEFSEGCIKMS